jgi:hypothetical protein
MSPWFGGQGHEILICGLWCRRRVSGFSPKKNWETNAKSSLHNLLWIYHLHRRAGVCCGRGGGLLHPTIQNVVSNKDDFALVSQFHSLLKNYPASIGKHSMDFPFSVQ